MPPLTIIPSRGKSQPFRFEIDEKDLARIRKSAERASSKSLHDRMQLALLTQGDIIANKENRAAPRGPRHNLGRSHYARPEKRGSIAVLVGPGHDKRHPGYHAHLVISGTGIRPAVSPRKQSSPWRVLPVGNVRKAATLNTGRMPKNPYIDRVISGVRPQVAAAMAKEWGALWQGTWGVHLKLRRS